MRMDEKEVRLQKKRFAELFNDLDYFELYLERMAAKGRFLTRMKPHTIYFRRDEPQPLLYRVEHFYAQNAERGIADYQARGWELVYRRNETYCIFSSRGSHKSARTGQSDAASYKLELRNMKGTTLISTILYTFIFASMILTGRMAERPPQLALYLIFVLVYPVLPVSAYLFARNTRKHYHAEDVESRAQRAKRYRIFVIVFTGLLTLLGLAYLITIFLLPD